jgi:hypothetical protein
MSRTKKCTQRDPVADREPLAIVADYRVSSLGPGWFASISVEHEPTRTGHGVDVHAALHRVLDEVALIADEHRRGLLTVHTLDGDPVAIAELTEQHGFVSCVDDDLWPVKRG